MFCTCQTAPTSLELDAFGEMLKFQLRLGRAAGEELESCLDSAVQAPSRPALYYCRLLACCSRRAHPFSAFHASACISCICCEQVASNSFCSQQRTREMLAKRNWHEYTASGKC